MCRSHRGIIFYFFWTNVQVLPVGHWLVKRNRLLRVAGASQCFWQLGFLLGVC